MNQRLEKGADSRMSKKKSKALKKRKKRSIKRLKRVSGPTEAIRDKFRNLDAKFRERFPAMGMDPDKPRGIENPDEPKMSAVILALTDSYIKKFWGDELRVRGIINIAIMAWNMTFLSKEEQAEFEKQLIEEVMPKDSDAQDISSMLRVLEEFQKKQKSLFPHVRNAILAHDLRLDRENIHLDISSIPIDK